MQERIAVVGLGYVGLPVALSFAREFSHVTGFDIDVERVTALRDGKDWTGECSGEELRQSGLRITSSPSELRDASFYVVAVPTPIDANNQPDLRAIESACHTVGSVLAPGDVVVFESTVYPGLT